MTPAMRRYHEAGLRLRIARAAMLADLAGKIDGDQLADLLTFARQIGDEIVADSVAAFRAAQEESLRAAQSELDTMHQPGKDSK